MKRLLCVATVLVCAAVPAVVPASYFSERVSPPGCQKPYKPMQFTSEWEAQDFKDQVRRYKQCIEDYVQDQKDANQQHEQAASDAIDE